MSKSTYTPVNAWYDSRTDTVYKVTYTIMATLYPRYCRKCGWIWGLPNYKYCPYCGEELAEEDC